MDRNPLSDRRIWRAFTPSKVELIMLPAISLLILLLLRIPLLFNSEDETNNEEFSLYMQTKLQEALSILDRILGTTIPTIIFWAFIGIIAYTMLFVALGAYNAYRNDMPVDRGMIVPKNYSYGKILRDSIGHIFIRILAAGMLINWVYMLFSQILPYVSSIFLQNISSEPMRAVGNSILAVILLSTWLFIISLLSRCVVLRDRVFTS